MKQTVELSLNRKGVSDKKRHSKLWFVCMLAVLLVGLLCNCDQQGAVGQPGTAESLTATEGQTQPNGNATDTAENLPTENLLPLTKDGKANVCVVFETGNEESNAFAKVLCNRLSEKTKNKVTFSKIGSKNYPNKSADYDHAIVIGEIEGVGDDLYATVNLRSKDSVVVQKDKRIGLVGYSNEAIINARVMLLEHMTWQNGTLYLDPAVFGKIKTGNYDISNLTLGDIPVERFTILTDHAEAWMGERLRDLIVQYSGYILSVTADPAAAGTYRLILNGSGAQLGGYEIKKDANDLLMLFDGRSSTFEIMRTVVERKLKGVSYGKSYQMEDLAMNYEVSNTVKIISFNVLNNGGDNTARCTIAADMILSELPDFFGLQEFDPAYRNRSFIERISQLYAEAEPQGVALCDVWNPVFYRKDLYSLVDCGYFHFRQYLSDEDSVEYGYRLGENGTSDGETKFRSLVWAVLEDRATGQRYLVGNFHYGVRGQAKNSDQIKESTLVIERFQAIAAQYGNIPSLICGDYNSNINDKEGGAYQMLQNGFIDTWANASVKTDSGSCHILGEAQTGTYSSAIDHIFTLSELDVRSYVTLTNPDLLTCSDHCPTVVEIAKPVN